jgi:putative ABC transport system permease protein
MNIYSIIQLFGHSFRQAWNIIRQEKLFSSIYILGTGLSITVVMALSIVFYIRIANIYPEMNRDRMLVVGKATEMLKDGTNFRSSNLSLHAVETCFKSLESAETVTAIYQAWPNENYLQPDGSDEQWRVTVKHVDTAFWTVFPFRFLHGRPFSEADFLSGVHSAVIAESLARRLFGTGDAVGRQVSLDFQPYRICGVVKDASFVTKRTYAQLWLPYTVHPDCRSTFGSGGSLGSMTACILAPSAGEVEKVRREAVERINSYSRTLKDVELVLYGQPDRQWQTVFRPGRNGNPDYAGILLQYGLLFFVLLLVPAVSLSGMADSRMERRMTETGIRRAFGAPARVLMWQIVAENFLFTFLGGVVGFLSSCLLVVLGRNWIMQMGVSLPDIPPAGTEVVFSPSMLLNLHVFGIALGVCFLLNLMSALIPAWKHSRRQIIYSLHAKQ